MNLFCYMRVLCEECRAFAAISVLCMVTSVFNSTLSYCKLPAYFEFLITAKLLTNESCLVPFKAQVSLPFSQNYLLLLITPCFTELDLAQHAVLKELLIQIDSPGQSPYRSQNSHK